MKRFLQVVSKLFLPGEPVPLGRWTLKSAEKQLTSPVADPGYYYMIHWSKVPAGELRRNAIKDHIDKTR